MATAVWTMFAVAAMVGIFAGCVVFVTAGVRVFEHVRAKRHEKPDA
jgi:hypothetical protein